MKVITVLSTKGGTWKTTLAYLLSSFANREGYKSSWYTVDPLMQSNLISVSYTCLSQFMEKFSNFSPDQQEYLRRNSPEVFNPAWWRVKGQMDELTEKIFKRKSRINTVLTGPIHDFSKTFSQQYEEIKSRASADYLIIDAHRGYTFNIDEILSVTDLVITPLQLSGVDLQTASKTTILLTEQKKYFGPRFFVLIDSSINSKDRILEAIDTFLKGLAPTWPSAISQRKCYTDVLWSTEPLDRLNVAAQRELKSLWKFIQGFFASTDTMG